MTTKLFIESYDSEKLRSNCVVVESDDGLSIGKRIYADLTVDGAFGEMPESELVGKTVTVDYLQPYEVIGVGVRIDEAKS